jgi:hypothetical protein
MGVKMIPPGVHLVTTQAVQRQRKQQHDHPGDPLPPAAAPALAWFVALEPRSVLVRGWDARVESLTSLAEADDEERLVAGTRRGDFDQGLAPYDLGLGVGAAAAGPAGGAVAATTPTPSPPRQSGWARWRDLAGLITPQLARRLMADGGQMLVPLSVTAEAAELEEQGAARNGDSSRSAAERRLEAQLAEGRRRRAQEQQQQQHQVMLEEEDDQPPPLPPQPPPPPPSSSSSPALARLALNPSPDPSRARYTPIDPLVKLAGLAPAQLTEANIDKSSAAEALLRVVLERGERGEQEEAAAAAAAAAAAPPPPPPAPPPLFTLLRRGGPSLLGELQFAFAAFAAGAQSLEGFNQWRSIACLLLECERLPFGGGGGEEGKEEEEPAAAAAAAFFSLFLRVLAAQLRYALGGGDSPRQQQSSSLLVDDDLLRQSFLPKAVRRFLSALGAAERQRQAGGGGSGGGLAEVRASAELVASALRGGGLLDDVEDEEDDDDDGPTVVDLDEGYAM